MKTVWASQALADLVRLHDFLSAVNPSAAAKVVKSLSAAPDKLIEHPRLGEKLDQFAPREVRRIIVGRYELRYELRNSDIFVLRLWHTRENR